MIDPQLVPVLITPDTNVLVSGGTISSGAPARIVDAWRMGSIDFALSPAILGEAVDVLSRPYFRERVGWTKKSVQIYIHELQEGSYIFPGSSAVLVSIDPDDNMLFATALEAGAQYIVSGDAKHVLPVVEFEGIKIVRPQEFVAIMKFLKQ